MGNRLRAELAKYTQKSHGDHPTKNPWDVKDVMEEIPGKDVEEDGGIVKGSSVGKLATQFSSKFTKLEKLQYALTKQVRF